jgi:hypothetical protein
MSNLAQSLDQQIRNSLELVDLCRAKMAQAEAAGLLGDADQLLVVGNQLLASAEALQAAYNGLPEALKLR